MIAPYEREPRKWLDLDYMDASNPLAGTYRITTEDLPGHTAASSDAPVRIMTWRDVAEAFDVHPEVKYCDQEGKTCSAGTIGVLQRRHVKIGYVMYIGKESNRLTEKDEPLPDLAPYEVPDYGSGLDDVRELAIPVLVASKLSNREIANQLRVDHETINRYFRRDNLTSGFRQEQQRVKNGVVKLAVKLALQMIPDSDRDVASSTEEGHIIAAGRY